MPSIQPTLGGSGGGRSRRGRAARVGTSLSEINVVPLVDVMLVLLIIFMVTAPLMQRGLDVTLPEARRAQQINAERLFVTVPLAYREDRMVQIGDESVRVDLLHERIRQTLLDQGDKDVYLRGDGGITYQELMSVIDQLKEGGVEQVALLAVLPGER